MSKARKDRTTQLLALAEQQGYRVQPTKKGYRVLAPGGAGSVCLHRTPSDSRAIKNSEADLRRIGVKL
jgi:hypothetical protein